jgi:iron complex transport system substrate-binding protein
LIWRATFFVAVVTLCGGGGAWAADLSVPHRIVSVNPCLDSILFHLADRDQITALSHFSRDTRKSSIAAQTIDIPITYETAEEIIALNPDLVLASRHTAAPTRLALERVGIHPELFGVPNTVKESLDQISRVAGLIGQSERGAQLVSDIEQALAKAAPEDGPPIPVVLFQPNGFSAGKGTLIDQLFQRTGFDNVAARYGVKQWGNVSLERLITEPPKMVLSEPVDERGGTWAEHLLGHPALTALAAKTQRAGFPERLLYCGGPAMIEVAQLLAEIHQRHDLSAKP